MGRAHLGTAASPARQLTLAELVGRIARDSIGPERAAARLLAVVLGLMLVGLFVQASHAATTSSSVADFQRTLSEHLRFYLLGLVCLACGYRVGPRRVRPFLPSLCLASGLLLVLVFVPPVGVDVNGSNRWVDLGLRFQPSELARLVVVLWVADRCVRLGPRITSVRGGVLPILGLVLVYFGLILVETDFGGSLLFLICALSVLWVGGAKLLPVLGALVGVAGGALALGRSFVPYIHQRLDIFLGNASNEQITRTIEALASGGLLGRGYGAGEVRNRGVAYLQSDFVFAQIGEELGLVGCALVLALLFAFLWFSLQLVLSLRDRYDALVAFGLLLSVALQAMLHVQVVSGLAPPKGMTLPFVSDGGTSLVVASLAVGLALGASRTRSTESIHATH